MERPPMFYVSGQKGGCGKSLMAIALVALFMQHRVPVLLVEADDTNSEAHHAYSHVEGVTVDAVNLDNREGWMILADIAEANADKVIVVNTGARQKEANADAFRFLAECMQLIGRELRILWMLNAQRDSAMLLADLMEAVTDTKVYAVRNLHFGPEDAFETYNKSCELRPRVESRGGTVNFPELADRLLRRIYTDRMPPLAIEMNDPVSNKVEMRRWLTAVGCELQQVIHA